jgi:hypothetical protein
LGELRRRPDDGRLAGWLNRQNRLAGCVFPKEVGQRLLEARFGLVLVSPLLVAHRSTMIGANRLALNYVRRAILAES